MSSPQKSIIQAESFVFFQKKALLVTAGLFLISKCLTNWGLSYKYLLLFCLALCTGQLGLSFVLKIANHFNFLQRRNPDY